jgi:hypothetical protein
VQVIDWAIQAHGAAGMCDDFPLAYAYVSARTLRMADGPDEVHRGAIAKLELGKRRSVALLQHSPIYALISTPTDAVIGRRRNMYRQELS